MDLPVTSSVGKAPDWVSNPPEGDVVGESECVHIISSRDLAKSRAEFHAKHSLIFNKCSQLGKSSGSLSSQQASYIEGCSSNNEQGMKIYLLYRSDDIECK